MTLFHKIRFFTAASLTSLLGFFQLAYHSSVINIPEPIFLQFLNETNIERYGYPLSEGSLDALWAWIVSIMSIGGLIGSIVTPYLAEKFGRKMTFMILSNLLGIGSSFLMSFSLSVHSYELLALGRFLVGLSSGVSSTVLTVYLIECSPTRHRGIMGTVQNIVYNLTNILSFLLAMPQAWGSMDSLPLLLGFGIVPSMFLIMIFFFLPESPKYLYINRKDREAAEKSLQFWNDGSEETKETIEATFHEFDLEADALEQEVGFLTAMKIPYFRRVMVITLVLITCGSATGISALGSYSADMFLKLGFDSTVTDVFINMLAFIATIGAIAIGPCIEKYSRRSMYFNTYIILVISLLFYTFSSVIYKHTSWRWSAYMAMASMVLYFFIFSSGPGGLTWVIPSELAPQAIRSTVNSVASAVSWGLSLIVTFLWPSAWHLMGASSYFMFIIPLVIGLVYLYRVMPETAGKSIAQIFQENSQGTKKALNGVSIGKHEDDVPLMEADISDA